MHSHCSLVGLLIAGFILTGSTNLVTGQESATCEATPAPVTFTTPEDHRNMLEQLGISKLRPGPNGNESAPDHANYDEALANPYPDLPPVLTLKTGEAVATPEEWW